MKEQQRKIMLAFLKEFSTRPLKKKKEIMLQEKLIASSIFKKARIIGGYFPTTMECDLSLVFEEIFKEGKILACPVAKNKKMTYYQVQENDQKVRSSFGILEPKAEAKRLVLKEDIDLLIVPGLIFNKEHFRIGFGGGYYDRFLADFRNETVSLVFKEQLQDFSPEKFDLPVKKIYVV